MAGAEELGKLGCGGVHTVCEQYLISLVHTALTVCSIAYYLFISHTCSGVIKETDRSASQELLRETVFLIYPSSRAQVLEVGNTQHSAQTLAWR